MAAQLAAARGAQVSGIDAAEALLADALRKFASDAMLTPIAVFDVESPFEYPDEATAVRGLNAAGVAVRAMENTGEQAVSEAHAKAVARSGNRTGTTGLRRLSAACSRAPNC